MTTTAHRIALGAMVAGVLGVCLGLWPSAGSPTYDHFAYPKELWLVATSLAAAAVCLAAARTLAVRRYDLILAAFVLLGVLSAVAIAPNQWLAVRTVSISMCAAAAFWTARSLASRGYGEFLLSAVCVALAATAVAVILDAHGQLRWSMPGRAPAGTGGNRNFTAHLLAIGAPLAMLWGLTLRRRLARSLAWMTVALLAHALLLSHCRAAWLASLVVCPAVLILAGARARTLATGAAVAIGVATAAYVPNQLEWASDDHLRASLSGMLDHRTGTGRGRLIQYANTASMASHHPLLGVGPGNWSIAYPIYSDESDPSLRSGSIQPVNRLPNSDWLGVLAERGAPALLLLAAFAVAVGAHGYRRHADSRRLIVPGTIAVVAIVGSLDAVLLRPAPALVTAVILGALVGPAGTIARVRLPAVARRAGAVGLIAVLALVTCGRGRDLQALHIVDRARALRAAERLSPGDYRIPARLAVRTRDCSHARAALHLHPNHPLMREYARNCAAHP